MFIKKLKYCQKRKEKKITSFDDFKIPSSPNIQ